jgi:hypothetical protein
MQGIRTLASRPARGRGTQRCRSTALACLGIAFAVTPAPRMTPRAAARHLEG